MSEADGSGLSQRELLMEMREDIRSLKASVEAIVRDQAAGVERRESARRVMDALSTTQDAHGRRIAELEQWRDRADGALTLARWALGASLVSLVGVFAEIVAGLSR